MEKISMKSNVITFFEIPVLDLKRAKKFYETILDIKMHTQFVKETDEEFALFTYSPDVIQATSGRVSGILTKSSKKKPSKDGTLVYINASPKIQSVIDKVEPAGGKVIVPKTKIEQGLISVIIDTEGNKVGLHCDE